MVGAAERGHLSILAHSGLSSSTPPSPSSLPPPTLQHKHLSPPILPAGGKAAVSLSIPSSLMPKRTSAATSSSQRSRSSGSSASLEDADDSPGGGRSLRTATHESSTSNGRTRPSSRTSGEQLSGRGEYCGGALTYWQQPLYLWSRLSRLRRLPARRSSSGSSPPSASPLPHPHRHAPSCQGASPVLE